MMILYKDKCETHSLVPEQEDTVTTNAEVQLQNGEEVVLAHVKLRAIGPEGKTVGEYHDDLLSQLSCL